MYGSVKGELLGNSRVTAQTARINSIMWAGVTNTRTRRVPNIAIAGPSGLQTRAYRARETAEDAVAYSYGTIASLVDVLFRRRLRRFSPID